MEKTTMPFARELKLELTNACGLACAHCSTDSGSTASLCIPTADAIRIVCQFRELGGERLILTGGEPLQHPEIDLIAAFSKQIGLQVVVYTTGLDINSDVSRDRLLHLAPIIDGFVFCLHAAVPDVHDHLTGVRGSFEATVSAISLVMRWGKPVCIHHVPLQPNRGEFLSLCTFVMRMGLRSLKILRFVPQGRGERNEARLALRWLDVDKLAEEIAMALVRFPALNIDLGAPYSMLGPCRQTLCGAGWRTLSIGANLECYPCDGFKSIAGGAFREPLASRALQVFWTESATLLSVRSAATRMQMLGSTGCLAQKFLANGDFYGVEEDPLTTYFSQDFRQAVSHQAKVMTTYLPLAGLRPPDFSG